MWTFGGLYCVSILQLYCGWWSLGCVLLFFLPPLHFPDCEKRSGDTGATKQFVCELFRPLLCHDLDRNGVMTDMENKIKSLLSPLSFCFSSSFLCLVVQMEVFLQVCNNHRWLHLSFVSISTCEKGLGQSSALSGSSYKLESLLSAWSRVSKDLL